MTVRQLVFSSYLYRRGAGVCDGFWAAKRKPWEVEDGLWERISVAAPGSGAALPPSRTQTA